MHFKKTIIQNGIRVVSEFHPQSRAVSIGLWVLSGTRDEQKNEAGVSHFLEHLVFKGTKTKTAYQIAKSLEVLGGELNAYTTREYTVYHCLVLKDHWKKGLEVLSDIVSNMSLSKEDFDLEKSVVLQEIAMGEDQLEEMVYDIYFEKSLPHSSLGKPILGNVNSISKMSMKQVKDYYHKNYSGKNIIVSGSGCVDHQDFVQAVELFLSKKPKKNILKDSKKPTHKPIRVTVEKTSEQLHLCMGLPVTSFRDRMRFEAFIVNALLGGGMTSKLYQSIREKKGLVYSVYSSLNTFKDFGVINFYAACDKKNFKNVFNSILKELKKIRKTKISEHDLNMYKTQVKGALLLGADDIENRMSSLAVNEMVFQKYKSVDEIIEEIDSVSTQSVNEFIKKYINPEDLAIVLLGSGAKELEPWLLQADLK